MQKLRNITVFTPTRFSSEIWLPALWAQAKTYYERHGKKVSQWNWVPCYADVHGEDLAEIKRTISMDPPDVFAVSLYVWNTNTAHEIAKWVKEQWPNCVVISGGPHQYFKHNQNWFREHYWLDASLPGDCYGEPFIAEVLDNYDTLNWDQIANAYFPKGVSRMVTASRVTFDRKTFDFSWAAFHEQETHIQKFVAYKNRQAPLALLLTILETTRGCPYGCTYCDWGGGINTRVIEKPVAQAQLDINALAKFNLAYLYIADANFGILKDRDVGIIEHLVAQRNKNNKTFSVGYGGFAKSENRINCIKQILEIDIKNNLSNFGEVKISLQSLDQDVLKNIDRKNIPLAAQLAMADSLNYGKVPVYAELILGLPGMTVDKFYQELDILGGYGIPAIWYEWILLPEAPAYDYGYREKHGIKVIEKRSGWYTRTNATNKHEIVIAGATFTEDDYLEMLLVSSLFKCFVQGGIYKKTVTDICTKNDIGLGQLCKDIYHNFFSTRCQYIKDNLFYQWHHSILNDIDKACFVDIGDQEVFCGLYFAALCFLCPEEFVYPLGDWLVNQYQCSKKVAQQERDLIITTKNISKKHRQVWWTVHYSSPGVIDFDTVIKCFMQFKNTGTILVGKKKLM